MAKTSKQEIIALIIAGFAMMGTVGNALFSWWIYTQREKTLLYVTTEPVLNEPVSFNSFFSIFSGHQEIIVFFNKVVVSNLSSKKTYITKVDGGLHIIGLDIKTHQWYTWGMPTGKFPPEETEKIYLYDMNTKKIKMSPLPISIDSGEQIFFFVKSGFYIGQEMIKNFNITCPDRVKRKITLNEVVGSCMNGSEIYSTIDSSFISSSDKILYKIKPHVTVYTTGGYEFSSKGSMYIVKKN